MKQQIIECVPNISEGRDLKKIKTIANVVTEVEGIKLLDIDPGKATNRTSLFFLKYFEHIKPCNDSFFIPLKHS